MKRQSKILKSAELFEKMLDRPVLYVGYASIQRIKAFIDGFEHSSRLNNVLVQDKLYTEFNQWTAKHFNITSMHNWADIISFIGQSEVKSFEITKQLWNEYKLEMHNEVIDNE